MTIPNDLGAAGVVVIVMTMIMMTMIMMTMIMMTFMIMTITYVTIPDGLGAKSCGDSDDNEDCGAWQY